METRGGVADYDPGSGELTSTRPPRRRTVCGCSWPRCWTTRSTHPGAHQDVGGAFGLKGGIFREDFCVAVARRQLGRPVKWIEDRNEHLMASGPRPRGAVDVEVGRHRRRRRCSASGARWSSTPAPTPACRSPRRRSPGSSRCCCPGPYGSGLPLRQPRRGHQQGDLRRLPRPVGGRDVDPRAAARHGRRRAGPRPGRGPPAQPASTAPSRRPPDHRADARRHHHPRDPRHARSSCRLRRLPRASRRRRAPRAATSASASPPSSRPRPARRTAAGRRAHRRRAGAGPARARRHAHRLHRAVPARPGPRDDAGPGRRRRVGVPFEHVRVVHGDTQVTPFSSSAPAAAGPRRWPAARCIVTHPQAARRRCWPSPPSSLEIDPATSRSSTASSAAKGVPGTAIPLARSPAR